MDELITTTQEQPDEEREQAIAQVMEDMGAREAAEAIVDAVEPPKKKRGPRVKKEKLEASDLTKKPPKPKKPKKPKPRRDIRAIFHRALKEINIERLKKPWMGEKAFRLIDTTAELREWAEALLEDTSRHHEFKGEIRPVLAVDTETTGLDTRIIAHWEEQDSPAGRVMVPVYETKIDISGICLSADGIEGIYIPVTHEIGRNIDRVECTEILQHLFDRCHLVFYHAKYDREVLRLCMGINLQPYPYFEDVQVLAYINDPKADLGDKKKGFTGSSGGLKALSKNVLGIEQIELKEIGKVKCEHCSLTDSPFYGCTEEYRKTTNPHKHSMKDAHVPFSWIPTDIALWYAAGDAICTWLLWERMYKLAQSRAYVHKIDHELVDSLTWIERQRFHIDTERLARTVKGHQKKLAEMREKLRLLAVAAGFNEKPDDDGNVTEDNKFNPGSTVQLQELLYKIKGFKVTKVTGAGNASCDAEVLEDLHKLYPKDEFLTLLLAYRDYMALHPENLHFEPTDNTARMYLKQCVVAGGRLAGGGGEGFAKDGGFGLNPQGIKKVESHLMWKVKGNVLEPDEVDPNDVIAYEESDLHPSCFKEVEKEVEVERDVEAEVNDGVEVFELPKLTEREELIARFVAKRRGVDESVCLTEMATAKARNLFWLGEEIREGREVVEVVSLTALEEEVVAAIAKTRDKYGKEANADNNKYGNERDSFKLHHEGALAECAFAKGMNLYWSSAGLPYIKDNDVQGIHVRGTPYPSGRLLVRPPELTDNAKKSPWVCVRGSNRNAMQGPFTLSGWAYGYECENEKYLDDPTKTGRGREPAYFVPIADCHRMSELHDSPYWQEASASVVRLKKRVVTEKRVVKEKRKVKTKAPGIINNHIGQYMGYAVCLVPKCTSCREKYGVLIENGKIDANEVINLRCLFVAPDGWTYFCVDYSNIEMRCAANISLEPKFVKEFLEGSGDFHSLTASTVFPEFTDPKTPKDVRKDLRGLAKILNFALLYGGTAYTIFENMKKKNPDITFDECVKMVDKYWAGVPKFAEFCQNKQNIAKMKMYCKTSTGRVINFESAMETNHIHVPSDDEMDNYWQYRKYIKQSDERKANSDEEGYKKYRQMADHLWKDPESGVRNAMEHNKFIGKIQRVSVNVPLQGLAGDFMRMALNRIRKWVESDPEIQQVFHLHGSVHDEIDFTVKNEYVPFIMPRITRLMKLRKLHEKMNWPVPIESDAEYGRSWDVEHHLTGDADHKPAAYVEIKGCENYLPDLEDFSVECVKKLLNALRSGEEERVQKAANYVKERIHPRAWVAMEACLKAEDAKDKKKYLLAALQLHEFWTIDNTPDGEDEGLETLAAYEERRGLTKANRGFAPSFGFLGAIPLTERVKRPEIPVLGPAPVEDVVAEPVPEQAVAVVQALADEVGLTLTPEQAEQVAEEIVNIGETPVDVNVVVVDEEGAIKAAQDSIKEASPVVAAVEEMMDDLKAAGVEIDMDDADEDEVEDTPIAVSSEEFKPVNTPLAVKAVEDVVEDDIFAPEPVRVAKPAPPAPAKSEDGIIPEVVPLDFNGIARLNSLLGTGPYTLKFRYRGDLCVAPKKALDKIPDEFLLSK